jgi:hypothetical protein
MASLTSTAVLTTTATTLTGSPVPTTSNNGLYLITSTTQLPSRASVLPVPVRSCGIGLLSIPDTFPACAVQASNRSLLVMNNCCGSTPVIAYNANCGLFCEARNRTLLNLNECILDGFNDTGGFNSSVGGILCNRAGASFSSLFPDNTADPATRTTSMRNTGTSTGAAARLGAPDVVGHVSLGAWATVFVLAMGGFASAFL